MHSLCVLMCDTCMCTHVAQTCLSCLDLLWIGVFCGRFRTHYYDNSDFWKQMSKLVYTHTYNAVCPLCSVKNGMHVWRGLGSLYHTGGARSFSGDAPHQLAGHALSFVKHPSDFQAAACPSYTFPRFLFLVACGPQEDGGEATNVTLSLDGTDGVLIGHTNWVAGFLGNHIGVPWLAQLPCNASCTNSFCMVWAPCSFQQMACHVSNASWDRGFAITARGLHRLQILTLLGDWRPVDVRGMIFCSVRPSHMVETPRKSCHVLRKDIPCQTDAALHAPFTPPRPPTDLTPNEFDSFWFRPQSLQPQPQQRHGMPHCKTAMRHISIIFCDRFPEGFTGSKLRCFDWHWGGKFVIFDTFAAFPTPGETRRGHPVAKSLWFNSLLLDTERVWKILQFTCIHVMVGSKLVINKRAFQLVEATCVRLVDHSFLIARSAFAGCPQCLGFDVGGPNQNRKTDTNTSNSGTKSHQPTQIRSCPDGQIWLNNQDLSAV